MPPIQIPEEKKKKWFWKYFGSGLGIAKNYLVGDQVPVRQAYSRIRIIREHLAAFPSKADASYSFTACDTGFELEPVSATQSSTLDDTVHGDTVQFRAANCIDGEVISDVGRSICHTNTDATPWLAIDYGTSVTVQRVEIFNRHDYGWWRTRNVDVRISDELPTSGSQMFSGGTLFGHFAGPGTDGQHIIISG